MPVKIMIGFKIETHFTSTTATPQPKIQDQPLSAEAHEHINLPLNLKNSSWEVVSEQIFPSPSNATTLYTIEELTVDSSSDGIWAVSEPRITRLMRGGS